MFQRNNIPKKENGEISCSRVTRSAKFPLTRRNSLKYTKLLRIQRNPGERNIAKFLLALETEWPTSN